MENLNYPGSLHSHTEYSNLRLRDCICKVEQLITYSAALGHSCVAITDHEALGNVLAVEQAAEKIKKEYPNFKVIRGNEIYLCRNGLNAENFNTQQDKYYHFILLAKDRVGMEQLQEISTRAWMRSYMARGLRRVPTYYQDLFDIIGANPGHVIGSTACLGGCLGTQLLNYRTSKDEVLYQRIENWVLQLSNLFGEGNFYLELQPSANSEQSYVNKQLVLMAKKLNLPYIFTTDTHYLKKEDAKIHKPYLNAQNGEREVDSFYATTYAMSTEEIVNYLSKDLSEEEIIEGFNNITKITEKCEEFTLKKPLKIPTLQWKSFNHVDNKEYWIEKIPLLKEFWESDLANRTLADAIINGIHSHPDCDNEEAYNEINECLRMTWESSVVNNASWSSYFLNLQRIIDELWAAGSLVGCGRGSGVGFILLYLLDITQINPLRETTKTHRWRFLNPSRVSVLDVDVDTEGGRRQQILEHLRNVYGVDRVANVATYRQEKSKSAILTACRGLGIDPDTAQYFSSLIPSDRGQIRTLHQCYYGDEESDWPPVKQFVIEMDSNPDLWEVAQKIEGLICGYGTHAGGVIFVDEPFTKSTALMRAPDGTIQTQLELHSAEATSLIKYDLLSVEAMDKIHICLDLLCEQNFIERKPTLKETYENVLGIYKLERNAPKMWEMVHEHKIPSLFQMEAQSGIQGIALTKPTSVDDLAVLNSVIRLMAQEKGAEQPLNKFARFKSNIEFWYEEMRQYGLTEEEMELLEPVVGGSYGISESQEKFMSLCQLPECGGFDLNWADSLRKAIAKKNPKAYDELTKQYFDTCKEKGLSENLCAYVWNVLIATSRGYGFNASHTLAYSLIALQEMNLAYRFPLEFWNCACLISDSGGGEKEENESEEIAWEEAYSWSSEVEDFTSETEEDEEDEEDDEEVTATSKKKKKTKVTDYGRIATAIGKMRSSGILVAPPDINKSGFTFYPDIENKTIRYGLSGISRINEDLVKQIIAGRPYKSFEDFLSRVKTNKPQTVNLIKSGAFDGFDDRFEIMQSYITSISDVKNDLNLRNLQMLITKDLIPRDKFDLDIRIFNFNKYLKKHKLDNYYAIDNIAFNFYSTHFDVDKLFPLEEEGYLFKIKQTDWDKIYKASQNNLRPYIKDNKDELLAKVNSEAIKEMWDKYATGTLSKWEMDSVSFYADEHELNEMNDEIYEVQNYFSMPETPEIERFIPIKGKMVPLMKITRIAGTILDKNKNKKLLSLLTKEGVVAVKIFGDVFTHYDRQISEVGADGKKHVIEKSFLARGNKVIITGVRNGDCFIAKKYTKTPYHLVEVIDEVNSDGTIKSRGERME